MHISRDLRTTAWPPGGWGKRAHACKSRAISEPPDHRPVVGRSLSRVVGESEHMHAHLARSPNGRVATRPLGKASTCMQISRDLRMAGWPPGHWGKRAGSSLLLEPPFCTRARRRADALLVVAARVRARLHSAQFSIEPAFVVGAVASNVNMEKLRTPRRGAAARRVGAFAANQRLHGWCSKHFPATCCSFFQRCILIHCRPGSRAAEAGRQLFVCVVFLHEHIGAREGSNRSHSRRTRAS